MTGFDEPSARAAGAMLGASRTSDFVEANVVAEALQRGDVVFTSDRSDLETLAEAISRRLQLVDG